MYVSTNQHVSTNAELTATLCVITGGGDGDYIAAVSGDTTLVLLWAVTS